MRVPAFALAEIAFLASLTSVNSEVSQLAAQGLRCIAQAERHPNAPVNPRLTEEERSKRNPIYEQLGDPSVVIVGKPLYTDRQVLCIDAGQVVFRNRNVSENFCA